MTVPGWSVPADAITVVVPMDDSPGRQLAGHTAVYGIATMLTQSVGLVTAPILTRHFSPERYGALEVSSAGVALLVVVVVAGLDVGLIRSYVADREVSRRQTMVSTATATVVVTSLGISALLALSARPVAGVLFGDRRLSGLVVAAAASVPFSAAAVLTRSVLRIQSRPWLALASATVLAIVGGTGGVVLAVTMGIGLPGIYAGIAVGSACAIALNVAATRRLFHPRWSRQELSAMLSVGLPLVPVGVSVWALRSVDRFILVPFVSLRQLGYYAVANRVANVILFTTLAFGSAWTPFILNLHSRHPDQAKALRRDVLIPVTAGMAMLALLLSAFASDLLRLLAGSRYLPAARVVPLLALALVCYATTPVTSAALIIHRATRGLAVDAVVAALVDVAGCLILVPPWGITGAAAATLLAFGYQGAAYYRRSEAVDRCDPPVGKIIGLLAMAVPYLALGYLTVSRFGVELAVKLPILATFPLVLMALGIIDARSLRVATASIGARRTR